jgi:hypothetical protein
MAKTREREKEEYIENAMITQTRLGYEDHGVMTAYITMDLGEDEGAVQAFGGLNLTQPEEMKKFVQGVVDAVGVSCWEELPGQHVRVKHHDGPISAIVAIGHILKDKWYIPECWLENKTKW